MPIVDRRGRLIINRGSLGGPAPPTAPDAEIILPRALVTFGAGR